PASLQPIALKILLAELGCPSPCPSPRATGRGNALHSRATALPLPACGERAGVRGFCLCRIVRGSMRRERLQRLSRRGNLAALAANHHRRGAAWRGVMTGRLEGKRALVTAAAQGIGRAA